MSLCAVDGTKVRLDYALIGELIEPGTRVLDLGCGDGELLEELVRTRGVTARGVEIDEEKARACLVRRVPVYQGDILDGLALYEDSAFDYIVLSQTLQEVAQPRVVLSEMLRVGKKAIISFPNFGHWRVRLQALVSGRAPRLSICPYSWHESPGRHVLTVKDVREFCRNDGLRIVDERFLSLSYRRLPRFWPNLTAALAVFVVVSSKAGAKT
ncbi:MAG: methionine biosynthesis protein MetW [Planctomycetes bacterium]|nr:methionine biosynthesis protein MetW [Planctomycetota bacterium]